MSKPETIHIPQDDRTRLVTVPIYEAERKRAAEAAETVAYALSDVANVFDLISSGLIGGQFSRNDAGVISLTRICSDHFRAMADTHGEHLHRLKSVLDNAARLATEKEQSK